MRAHQAKHPIRTMARVLGVSASGYYAWCVRPASQHATADGRLTETIRAIHRGSRETYGVPRVHADLRATDVRVSRKRVARLMRAAGLAGISRRKGTITTRRSQDARPAPDLVERQFVAAGADQLWVADITYIPTWAGFLYLAVVLDAWSRRIVGWAMATHLRTELVLDALEMAHAQRRPRNVIHHSDQGCQYASSDYRALLAAHGVVCSMSRRGNCWDNAVAESFFSTLKSELVHDADWATHVEAYGAVAEYLEIFYNTQRRHSALGYVSPVAFERQHRERLAA